MSLLRVTLAASLAALFLGGCYGKTYVTIDDTGSGGGGSGGTPGPSILYGDWGGILRSDFVGWDRTMTCYVRFDERGNPLEVALGLGLEFDTEDGMSNSWTASGGFTLIAGQIAGNCSFSMDGQVNGAGTRITGRWTLDALWCGETIDCGTFDLYLLTDLQLYEQTDLAGSWLGEVWELRSGAADAAQVEFDDYGSLVSGGTSLHTWTSGQALLSDLTVGRFDDVVLTAADGSTQTLIYGILEPSGKFLSGPFECSKHGAGFYRFVHTDTE